MVSRYRLLRLILLMSVGLSCIQFATAQAPHKFPLTQLENSRCKGKGRLQDCTDSPVIRQILAGGMGSIPVLIAQLTETDRSKEPVEDFWSYTKSGEVAFMLLNDLFTDKDGKTFTMPGVPNWVTAMNGCGESAEACWRIYVHRRGMLPIQTAWQTA
jgi:hypothetical protein